MNIRLRSTAKIFSVTVALLLVCTSLAARTGRVPGLAAFRKACDSVETFMSERCWCQYPVYIKTAYISNNGKKNARLVLVACRDMAYFPFRDGDIEHIYAIFKQMMPPQYAKYRNRFTINANNHKLQAYTPAYFSSEGADYYVKEHKAISAKEGQTTLLKDISLPFNIKSGLSGRHIALWQSHGYYYHIAKERWEWQRGRIFGTSEDLYTQSYVIPFLVPMLENACATVIMPRERDINSSETIVDNDDPSSGYTEEGRWNNAPKKGFAAPDGNLAADENPFRNGTARQIHDSDKSFYAKWQPEIPEDGNYSIYISYQSLPTSSEKARYTVCYEGGSRTFEVNQKLGGGTWIHLGKFHLKKGRLDNQYVRLEGSGNEPNTVITADAVRFGGGKGNIARNGKSGRSEISGKPRYMEAARYWLQWAGFNDTIYSSSSFKNDYKDDVKCRALWANTLKYDYHIPIDLCFALHTDAGLRRNDSIVGTLAIHTWKYEKTTKYRNGERRFLGRDLADIIQTNVVSDIRALYDSTWTRRGLWDRSYAECSSEQMPSMILELLSHQNFNDMRYGLDPVFRFHVSRAVYKGITEFLSWLNGVRYVIQPLPVQNFNVRVQNVSGRNYAVLSWEKTDDPLEPTAVADRYVIFKRTDDGGFDNGTVVESTSARFEIPDGHIFSFKVCALNDGGMSFPSETLCAAAAPGDSGRYALVANNFTRISGPSSFMSQDSLKAGFEYGSDAGVPYIYDIAYCGDQYEFNVEAEWESNDYPGFGASRNDHENTYMAGNTFDNVYQHASALYKAGFGIVSSSRKSILAGKIDVKDYPLLDLICGKQKKSGGAIGNKRDYSAFPDSLCRILTQYASEGRAMIVSGAYAASDISTSGSEESRGFLKSVLKAGFAGSISGECGEVRSASGDTFHFYSKPNPRKYHIEKPDRIDPSGSKVIPVLEYPDGGGCAGVLFKSEACKSAFLTIPIESLKTAEEIDSMMGYLVEQLF